MPTSGVPAGKIIAAADKTGKVDADAALRLKALVDAQLAALNRNAEEAKTAWPARIYSTSNTS